MKHSLFIVNYNIACIIILLQETMIFFSFKYEGYHVITVISPEYKLIVKTLVIYCRLER